MPNSFPSGSARTVHDSSPDRLMSTLRAPRPRARSTSAAWSTGAKVESKDGSYRPWRRLTARRGYAARVREDRRSGSSPCSSEQPDSREALARIRTVFRGRMRSGRPTTFRHGGVHRSWPRRPCRSRVGWRRGVEERSSRPCSPCRRHRLTPFDAQAREMPSSAATWAIGRCWQRCTRRRRTSGYSGALRCVTGHPGARDRGRACRWYGRPRVAAAPPARRSGGERPGCRVDTRRGR
jgi:hypothetical protein